jgi:hypothetical protein
MKKALALLPFLVALFPLAAVADDTLKFRGGIGVIPVASGVGLAATAEVVNRNIVRGVGQIWVISALTADVKRATGVSASTAGACCWAEATP